MVNKDGLVSGFASSLKQGPGSIMRPLKDKLRSLCKERRIRLQDFFRAYDVHHNKKVPP